MLENGWEFKDRDGGTRDHLFGSDFLWQIYTKADPDLFRPRDRACSLGQADEHHRLQ